MRVVSSRKLAAGLAASVFILGVSSFIGGQSYAYAAPNSQTKTGVKQVKKEQRGQVAANKRRLTARQKYAKSRTAAWIPNWDRARVIKTLRANGAQLGNASPFWFELDKSGRKIRENPGAWDREILNLISNEDTVITPTISNSFDAKRLSRMLKNKTTRTRHVKQLVLIASRPEVDGLDIDYENLAVKDRVKFVHFVRELARELHRRDRVLSVTVMAATGPKKGSIGASATDYKRIGELADEVRVMAYDYHWSCGRPGPIAPIKWVRDVVDYLVTEIPAEKLVLGIPLYAYDWPKRGCATARVWQDVNRIQRSRRSGLRWVAGHAANVLRYSGRTMWFENAAATARKARIAAEYDLKGVAMWRLGGEDPATWRILAKELGYKPDIDSDDDNIDAGVDK